MMEIEADMVEKVDQGQDLADLDGKKQKQKHKKVRKKGSHCHHFNQLRRRTSEEKEPSPNQPPRKGFKVVSE